MDVLWDLTIHKLHFIYWWLINSVTGICVALHQLCSLDSLNKAAMLYRLVLLSWFGSQVFYSFIYLFILITTMLPLILWCEAHMHNRELWHLSAESRNYKYSSGQQQNSYYFINSYYYLNNMLAKCFSKPFNHLETFSHLADTSGTPRPQIVNHWYGK